MKGPYCETIRCETPVRQKKAGALSYFSSGSFTSGLRGAVWPDAMERRDSNTRQVKQLALDTLKHLEMRRVYRSVRGSSRNLQHEPSTVVMRLFATGGTIRCGQVPSRPRR